MAKQKKGVSMVVALVIIAVLAYAAYWLTSKNSISQKEEVACTQDALLCPDGSYVGRTGPQCAFVPCPNQSSFTGTLRQDANGFALIFGSPEGSIGEITYTMPLILKVSNVVGQLVGQKVRAYGTFTEGITLSVDRLEELSGNAGDPTLGEIGVGKGAFINGVRITLNKIVQDSRCPVDVQCVWAGEVIANVTLQSDTDKETRDVSSRSAVPIPFDSFQISIENVKPSHIASAAPIPESYLVTFRVRTN